MEYHEKALVIGRNVFGKDHADLAKSYGIVGSVYYCLAQHKQAKEHHVKGIDHPEKTLR